MSGDYAVLENRENGEIFQVLKELVSNTAKEGDILQLMGEKYVVDIKKTNQQREYVRSLMEKLKKK